MMQPTTSILGVHVSAVTYPRVLAYIDKKITQQKGGYICVSPVHLVMECQRDQRLFQGVNAADIVTPDGMPLVWLSRLYGQTEVKRVYGPTLTRKICEVAVKKRWKIFLLGGLPGQSTELKIALQKIFPGIKVVGNADTPDRPPLPKENTFVIKKIRQTKADVVFVGMGCPFQEKWMSENHQLLPEQILIGVGAAFSFLTGKVRQAPEWMQNAGLEWFFRLTQEPRRLWYRYLVFNTLFVVKIAGQLLRDIFTGQLKRS